MFRIRLVLIGTVSVVLLGTLLLPRREAVAGNTPSEGQFATYSCACGIVYFGGVFRLLLLMHCSRD